MHTSLIKHRVFWYMMHVAMEDPNHPRDPMMEPTVATLDDTVKMRLKDMPAKEAQMRRRIFWIDSDWSEASPAISLPEVDFYYAANAQTPKVSPVRPDRPPVVTKEAEGRLVAVSWDNKHSIDVPAVIKVERATLQTGALEKACLKVMP